MSRHLAVLTTAGDIVVYTLPPYGESAGCLLAPRLTRTLACYSTSKTKRLALCAFDKAYLAVVGETPDKKCMQAQLFAIGLGLLLSMSHYGCSLRWCADMLSVWDMEFGTLQGRHDLRPVDVSLKATSSNDIYEVVPTSSLDKGGFAIILGRHLDMCPVYCSPFSLAAAMGRMQDTAAALDAKQAENLSTPPMLSAARDVLPALKVRH